MPAKFQPGVSPSSPMATRMAEYNSLANGRLAQIWYLDNPEVGTHSITATYTADARSRMAVISLQNVAAGGPIVSNSIVNGASSINLTTTQANTLVIGSCVQNTDPATVPDPFSTTLYNATSGSSWAIAGYRNETLAGLKTYSYAGSDGDAGIAVAGFTPATAETPSTVLEITVFSFDPTGAASSSISFTAAATTNFYRVQVSNP